MDLRAATKDENVPCPRTLIMVAARDRGRATLGSRTRPQRSPGRSAIIRQWSGSEGRSWAAPSRCWAASPGSSTIQSSRRPLGAWFACRKARDLTRWASRARIPRRSLSNLVFEDLRVMDQLRGLATSRPTDHLRLADHSRERSDPLRQLRSDEACWSRAATRAIRIRRA